MEAALDEAERQVGTDSPEPEEQIQEENDVSPCEAQEDGSKNSELPSNTSAIDGPGVDASSYGVFEGEEPFNDGDIDRKDDAGVDDALDGSEADSGDD